MRYLEQIAVKALQTASIPREFYQLTKDEMETVAESIERDIEKSQSMVDRISARQGRDRAPGARQKIATWKTLMGQIRAVIED